VKPWFERFARLGYATKGLVYITTGLLAMEVVLGIGGEVTDLQGAIKAIVMQPFGEFLVLAIAVGLVGYVFWRFVQALLDPEREAQTWQRGIQRLGYGLSGLAYIGLSVAAAKLLAGIDPGDSESASVGWTARILAQPLGRWLVALGGVIAIATALSYGYTAYRAKFREQFDVAQMSESELIWATALGRLGFFARGFVFSAIGCFLLRAALRYDPLEAKGFGGALLAIARQPYGIILLGLVALGLIAYGIYEVVLARYRRIEMG
jgi:hypothetical protein